MDDRMLYWLGRAAREARERAGRKQVHIAATLGINQDTISRFEQGRTWPRNPDIMLAAYAEDLGIDPRDIWDEALRRWREHHAASLADLLDR